jgi:Mg2+/Co2+ transporter CorB
MDLNFVLIICSLICSAFFSAMELAFISANRLRIEVLKKNNTFQGKILALFYRKESNMIALLLLGNNVALVVYGIAAGAELSPLLEKFGFEDQVSYVSTGGGALLEYMEGKELPGVKAIYGS